MFVIVITVFAVIIFGNLRLSSLAVRVRHTRVLYCVRYFIINTRYSSVHRRRGNPITRRVRNLPLKL